MNSPWFVRKSPMNRGQVLVLTALGMIFFVGMIAVVTDVGWMYASKNKLETAVNAGWKAGFDEMKKIKSASNIPLSTYDKYRVTMRIQEVILKNGYSTPDLMNVNIAFGSDDTLTVTSSQTVGLFFARVIGYNSANVDAGRVNTANNYAMIPIGIPHGPTKDISKTRYIGELFPEAGVGPGNEFSPEVEYIIKLGNSGPDDIPLGVDPASFVRILVPMDVGTLAKPGQGETPLNETKYLKAYGVVHWILGQSDLVPADWLIGYRGGAFMLKYHDDIIARLSARSIYYEPLTAAEANDIYTAVGDHNLELSYQPLVKVYSSQTSDDPVELILKAAEIPYGGTGAGSSYVPYKVGRTDPFAPDNCSHIYDTEILTGQLNTGAHWLHLHHEDFTGNDEGRNPGGDTTDNAAASSFGFVASGSYTAYQVMKQEIAYKIRQVVETGHMMYTQCFATETLDAALWMRRLRKGLLGDLFSDCMAFTGFSLKMGTPTNSNQNVAGTVDRIEENNAIVSVVNPGDGALEEVAVPTSTTVTSTLKVAGKVTSVGTTDSVVKLTSPRSMKNRLFTISNTDIKANNGKGSVSIGDRISKYSLTTTTITPTSPLPVVGQAYTVSISVTTYTGGYPTKSPFTTINTKDSGNFNLHDIYDPRQQDHQMTNLTGFGGKTTSFNYANIRLSGSNPVTVMGSIGSTDATSATSKKYLSGYCGTGLFTFTGGHNFMDTPGRRLVLNNVLLGSKVAENIALGTDAPLLGKLKNNYGVVDPDNIASGSPDDYLNRLTNGFNSPTQLSDRILPEIGNQQPATDQGIASRVATLTSRFVVVPITDIPPEVPGNNSANATATTIYDLVGQDNPNGVYNPASYSFGASVRIIGYALFEILDPTEWTRVGTNIQPGDAGDLGPAQSGQIRGKFIRYIVKPGEMPVN